MKTMEEGGEALLFVVSTLHLCPPTHASPQGKDALIELYLYQSNYSNAIQTTCPHVLRYLTAAVITTKRRRSVLKDLVRLIQQESYSYRDPITEFVECLYVNFDFDGAQKKLKECEQVRLGV
jgi:translation initiation factor 3 subunit E